MWTSCPFFVHFLAIASAARPPAPSYQEILNGSEAKSCHIQVSDVFSSLQVNRRITGAKKVAVFVSGTLQRYQPDSSATHLVAPMAQKQYNVDYYIHLNASAFTPWSYRAGAFVLDQRFVGLEDEALRQEIIAPITNAGANVRSLVVSDERSVVIMTDGEARFVDGTSIVGKRFWNCQAEHCLLRARAARQNFLLRNRALDMLWSQATAMEDKRGSQYDYVIVHDDDVAWAHDFDFEAFLLSQEESLLKGVRAFTLMCGEGSTYKTPGDGYTDTIGIFAREAAEPFLTLYRHAITPDTLGFSVDSALEDINSEAFEKLVGDYHNIQTFQVPAATIPVQRVGRVKEQNKITTCYHMVCMSEDGGRDNLLDGIEDCVGVY